MVGWGGAHQENGDGSADCGPPRQPGMCKYWGWRAHIPFLSLRINVINCSNTVCGVVHSDGVYGHLWLLPAVQAADHHCAGGGTIGGRLVAALASKHSVSVGSGHCFKCALTLPLWSAFHNIFLASLVFLLPASTGHICACSDLASYTTVVGCSCLECQYMKPCTQHDHSSVVVWLATQFH